MNTPHSVWHDPIVAEIHAMRERLASQYQNDLAAYSQAAETHCRALGFPVAEDSRVRREADDDAALHVHSDSIDTN